MTLRCLVCGVPDVFVCSPGVEPDGIGAPGLAPPAANACRGQAQRCWCEPHALAAGWPWLTSERTRATGQGEITL